MDNRKYYIDNLRTFAILLLFPYHIFMIYNNWGELFYITGEPLFVPSIFIQITWIWIMPLLFAIAGMSSRYALKQRNAGEYVKERVHKLFIPLIFGLLLIIPIQSYLASLFHTGEANFLKYFTTVTDFYGGDGAFTPGQLWFIAFLFVISMICIPFMIWYKRKGKGTLGDNVPLICIILMGLLPCIAQNSLFEVIDIGGKHILEYSVYFLLGYFLLSNDKILEKLDKYRFLLLGLFISYTLFTIFILKGELFEATSWFGILTFLAMGRHYLNFTGKISKYLSNSSFGVYIFHQSWIVITAFFVFKIADNPIVQMLIIFPASIITTYLTYELCKQLRITRWMFGLRK